MLTGANCENRRHVEKLLGVVVFNALLEAAGEPEVEFHLEHCAQLLETLDPDGGSFVQRVKSLNPRSSRFGSSLYVSLTRPIGL